MWFLVLLCSIAALVVWYFVSLEFYKAAEAKGYPQKKYLWLTFLLGTIGILLIIALPDRCNNTENVPNSNGMAISDSAKNTIEPVAPLTNDGRSVDDELRKYKTLLDQGVISEEEYNRKKEQLLKLI